MGLDLVDKFYNTCNRAKLSILGNKYNMEMVNFLPSFKCKDIGMNCTFEANAKNSAELMKMINVHEKNVHHMKAVPHDTMEKIKKAIKQ